MNRSLLLLEFLKLNNLAEFKIEKIAGDASFRHYFRASQGQKSFIIMDAPPISEDVKPFCKIAEFLLQSNFSAPKIFAKDYQNGFLLLEDFGDDSYRKVLERDASRQESLYQDAIDVLVDLRKINHPKDLPIYDEKLLLKEAMLFADWYLPNVAQKPLSDYQRKEFESIWLDLFSQLSAPNMMVLRDYHSDNLMIIKDRLGVNKVGLLDFQDAVIGVGAYDLVSLLEDARRDVEQNLQEKMLQYYIGKSKCDQEQFLSDYKIISLQRNIKIMGIFARLAFRDDKKNYLDLLPRVFGYIKPRLADSQFQAIKPFLYKS
jgi:aminoglycoside/choline kinase family phosphotransferase